MKLNFEDIALGDNNSVLHHLVVAKFSKLDDELRKIETDTRYFRLGSAHREIVNRLRAVLEEINS